MLSLPTIRIGRSKAASGKGTAATRTETPNFILPLPDNLISLASFPPSSLSDPDGLTESGTNGTGTENGNLESVTSGTATFNTQTAGSAYLYSATEI